MKEIDENTTCKLTGIIFHPPCLTVSFYISLFLLFFTFFLLHTIFFTLLHKIKQNCQVLIWLKQIKYIGAYWFDSPCTTNNQSWKENILMREEHWSSFLFVVKEIQCHVIYRFFVFWSTLSSNFLFFPSLSLVCINGFLILALQHLVPSFHDKKCLPSYLFSASHAHEFQQQVNFFRFPWHSPFQTWWRSLTLHMMRRKTGNGIFIEVIYTYYSLACNMVTDN